MLKQFVPQEVCLTCHGCCRYSQSDSVWAPCLLDAEIQHLVDKPGLPAAFMSPGKRIQPIPDPQGAGFICAFFNLAENKCKIYNFRPFECQLYPFLISLRGRKVILTLELDCPYIKENLTSPGLKDYIDYLTSFLNSPAQLRMFKDNPQLLQAYEEVLDIGELKIPDETE